MYYTVDTCDHFNTKLDFFPSDDAEALDIYALVLTDDKGQAVDEFDFKSAADLFDYAEAQDLDIEEGDVWRGLEREAEEFDDAGRKTGDVNVFTDYHLFYIV